MTHGTSKNAVAIVGIGEIPPVRRSNQTIVAMAVAAAKESLDDAGLRGSDVDGIITEASNMPHDVPADQVATALGMTNRRLTLHANVAGAGIVGAPLLAAEAIRSGAAEVVLSYYALDWGSAAGGPYAFHAGDPMKSGFEMPFGWYGQPVYFAAMAQRYRHEFGLTAEQTGAVALAARAHARNTPGAMKREPLDLAEYVANRMIADPLRQLDCCLLNDGGVAFVMTSMERARDLRQIPVEILGGMVASESITQSAYFTQKRDYLATPAVLSGPPAMKMAGITHEDVDFAEIYDCFTISTILQLEDLGFCNKGEGGAFFEDGRTGPGGSLPVNTHGGLLSHSYLLAGNHVTEAVRQLRGDRGDGQVPGAEVGLVTGLGVPDHTTLVLGRSK
jgi:acetyl-CoA acetyltransferase